MFEKVKRFYDMGLYTKAMVYMFYSRGKITEEQYHEICGTDDE